jgi:hypothetical protein
MGFCDYECKIMLEDKERAYNKMINRNTRQNEQEYKSERKEAIKIIKQKEECCINQIWSKWKLLILLTVKQRNFIKKVNSITKGFMPRTLLTGDKEHNIVSNKEKSPAKVVGIV